MEKAEQRELPGNDASWYRALLGDQGDSNGERQPEQATLIPLDEPDSEATVTSSVVEVEKPIASVDEDPEVDEPAPPEADDTSDEIDEPDGGVEETALPSVDDSEVEDVAAPVATALEPAVLPDEPVEFPDDPGFQPVPVDDDSPVDNTSEMVGQLWTAQEPPNPLDDWETDAMDRKIASKRPFRWTSVGAALLVLGLIIVGLVLLPSITRNRADNHREMMTEALFNLRTELDDTQRSLETATDPASSVVALNDLSTQLTTLSAKASDVNEAGSTELPAAPPLTSSSPIDELVPIQQRLEPLATTAQTIQRRIGNLVEYRTLMDGFLVLPELPSEADAATQTDLRVRLASAQAESASILADLPSDVSLSEHQEAARVLNDDFAAWQVEYLEALRTGDTVAAQRLASELAGRLDELDTLLVTPLAQIRRQTDADVIDLANAIDQVRTMARGEEPAA